MSRMKNVQPRQEESLTLLIAPPTTFSRGHGFVPARGSRHRDRRAGKKPRGEQRRRWQRELDSRF